MGKIIVLVGPHNSGKSTWSNQFIEKNKNYIRVSRDDFRRGFYSSWSTPDAVEEVIIEVQDCAISGFLSRGYNVILDNSHCKLSSIEHIINNYSKDHDIIFKVFDVDVNTLMTRNSYRRIVDGKYIPDNVLENVIQDFNELKEKFDFKDIIH